MFSFHRRAPVSRPMPEGGAIWGPDRSRRSREALALEALAGWEPTNCGAGIVHVRAAPPCAEQQEEVPVAVVHNIVSTSLLLGVGAGSMPINLQVGFWGSHAHPTPLVGVEPVRAREKCRWHKAPRRAPVRAE